MINRTWIALGALLTSALPLKAASLGSAFTYQGRLNDGANPANGTYEILFRPFGVFTGGSQLTIPNIRSVTVTNGLFTTTMDFGPGIFDGGAVYLQLEVRTNGAAGYNVLSPRQPLTATPYATFSSLSGTVPNGAIGSAQLANFIDLGATNVNGRLDVYRTAANTPAISLIGSSGQMNAYGDAGQQEARVEAASYGGRLTTFNPQGNETAHVGSALDAGGSLQLFQANGTLGVNLQGDLDGANGGGFLRLFKGNGSIGLTLQADISGESRITTQVLQITGGADLSEVFDVTAPEDDLAPGMIVCIDPEHPGRLVESAHAYDRTVAGVMSGAGGVKPGMLMGQQGTSAYGKHPVALSGRVYCQADASGGAIHPGDLLTTSATPGHAMKVTDYDKAHGAIIGKAMSSLGQGEGLVLVLVSLQ